MFIVIYRPHNTLILETTYYGPFTSWSEADDCLCELPALGIHEEPDEGPAEAGVKFTQELTSPNTVQCRDRS